MGQRSLDGQSVELLYLSGSICGEYKIENIGGTAMKIIKFPAADETTAYLLDVPNSFQALCDAIGAEKLRFVQFEQDVCLAYDLYGAKKGLPFVSEIPCLGFNIYGDVLVMGIKNNHPCDVPEEYIDFVFGGEAT